MILIKIVIPLIFLKSISCFGETKKILFLDLNRSETEINVAREMAKKRGEELIVYPKNKKKFNQNELDKILEKNKFKSLVLSGHNGGSSFEGENGRLSISELVDSIEKSKNTNIESLYLLGCNSANKSKIFFWKSALPKLKFIAGYDGTAPLNKVKSGLNFFRDTLDKENSLISNKDKDNLKTALSKIQSIDHLNTSLYVSCGEESRAEYSYFGKKKGDDKFSELNAKECGEKIKEYKDKYSEKILKYWSGDLEPTLENTKDGFVRKAYTFMRQNEHCFNLTGVNDLVSAFSGDSLLFLLFNKNFNENFSDYYNEIIKDALKEVELTIENPDRMADKILAGYQNRLQSYNKILQNYDFYEEQSKKEQKKLESEIKQIFDFNPGLMTCMMNRTRECSNQFKDMIDLVQSKQLTESLLKTMSKDYIELMATIISNIQKEDVLSNIQNAQNNLNESKIILTKMLNTPSQITRGEMMSLSHNFHIPGLQNKSLSALKTALSGAEQLSDSFPFSWHERRSDGEVPDPDKRFIVKNLKNMNLEMPANKDLADLMKAMLDI